MRTAPHLLVTSMTACVLMLVGVFDPCEGGSVVSTARVRSLGVPALLTEDEGLVFEFPQLATNYPGRVVALAVSGNGEVNAGGLGVFLGDEHLGLTLVTQTVNPILPDSRVGRVYQAGLALRRAGLKLGLALTGGRRDEEDSRIHEQLSTGAGTSDVNDRESRLWEGSIGLSLESGRTNVDVAVRLRRERASSLNSRLTDSSYDSFFEDTHSQELDPSPLFSGRLQQRVTQDLSIRVSGRWRRDVYDSRSRTLRITSGDTIDRETSLRPRSKQWSAGLGLEKSFGRRDKAILYANYDHTEIPSTSVSIFSSTFVLTKDEALKLGSGLAHAVNSHLEIFAGVYGVYRKSTQSTERLAFSSGGQVSSTDRSRSLNEQFSDRFSWGASWTQEQFHATASMDTNLDIDDLFLNLDVAYVF